MLFLFLLIFVSLISWRMMTVTHYFSLSLTLVVLTVLEGSHHAKHTPEANSSVRRPFSQCPNTQLYHSIFSTPLPPDLAHWVTQDCRAWSVRARWLRWHLVRLEWCWLVGESTQKRCLGWFWAQLFVDGVCRLRAQCSSPDDASRNSEPLLRVKDVQWWS